MRFSDFSEAIVQQANCREVVRVPMMSGGIVRLEIDGSPEFPVAARPVPIDEGLYPAERCVSLGQVVVDVKSHASRLSSLWVGLCRRQASVGAKNEVGIGNPGVSVTIIWVLSHGLKKIFESRLLALSGPLPPAIAALKVKVMGSDLNRQSRRKRDHNLGLEPRPEENIRVPPARPLWSFAASNSGPEGKGHGLEDRPYPLLRVAQHRSPAVWRGLGRLWPEPHHLAERGRRPGRARSSEPTDAFLCPRQSTAR